MDTGLVWLIETVGAVSGLYANGYALYDFVSDPMFQFSSGAFPTVAAVIGLIFAPLAVAEAGCWVYSWFGDCSPPSERTTIQWVALVGEAIATVVVAIVVIYLFSYLSAGFAGLIMAAFLFLLLIAYFLYLLARFNVYVL